MNDLLAYGRHTKPCIKAPQQHCTCGLELAYRKAERALGIATYPKSYLPEGA